MYLTFSSGSPSKKMFLNKSHFPSLYLWTMNTVGIGLIYPYLTWTHIKQQEQVPISMANTNTPIIQLHVMKMISEMLVGRLFLPRK